MPLKLRPRGGTEHEAWFHEDAEVMISSHLRATTSYSAANPPTSAIAEQLAPSSHTRVRRDASADQDALRDARTRACAFSPQA